MGNAELVRVHVAKGAAWLDEELPGWAERIDLARLRLRSECDCVLGQLVVDVSGDGRLSDYARAVDRLSGYARAVDPYAPLVDLRTAAVDPERAALRPHDAYARGFFGMDDQEYGLLEREWARVIIERRTR